MNKPLISVIVPIFNTERYLKSCITSILNQSYKNIELICIDDKSTDGSSETTFGLIKEDVRARLINLTTNIGLGAARNLGISEAKGEYICFFDSDDWIDYHYIESLFRSLIENNADVSKGNIKRAFNEKDVFPNDLFRRKEGIFESQDERLDLFVDWFGTTNTLVSLSLLRENDIRFLTDGLYYEDFMFYLKLYFYAKKVVYKSSNAYYYYRIRKDSITQTDKEEDKKVLDSFIVTSKILDFCDSHNILHGERKFIIKRIFIYASSDFLKRVHWVREPGFKSLKRLCEIVLLRLKLFKKFKKLFVLIKYRNWRKLLFLTFSYRENDLYSHFAHIARQNLKQTFNTKSITNCGVVLNGAKEFKLRTFFPKASYGKKMYKKNIYWGAATLKRVDLYEVNDSEEIFLAEDGFLRSVDTWANDSTTKKYNFCSSILVDDLAFHFSAHFPSRMELILNSDLELNSMQLKRSKHVLDMIVSNRLSKYNFQPLKVSESILAHENIVIVIDQSYGDASVYNSNSNEKTFELMLKDAIQENPDCMVIVKTHPDAIVPGQRKSFYTPSMLTDIPNAILYTDAINPISLLSLDSVRSVYVCSSGMGFEALMCGKKVITYGVPFYSGWGLTEDRNPLYIRKKLVNRRSRKRGLLEVFFIVYIQLSIYKIDEPEARVCEVEEICSYLIRKREEYFLEMS